MSRNVMRPFRLVVGPLRVIILASLALQVAAYAQPLAGSSAAGPQIATAICGTCHQVMRERSGRPREFRGHRQHDLNYRAFLDGISSHEPQRNA